MRSKTPIAEAADLFAETVVEALLAGDMPRNRPAFARLPLDRLAPASRIRLTDAQTENQPRNTTKRIPGVIYH